MILGEKTKYYSTQDLLDMVDGSLLNEEVKQILKDYISEISIQYSEIYHQLSKQSLTIDVYRKYRDVRDSFAELILNCLSSESINKEYISKQIAHQESLIDLLLRDLESILTAKIYDILKNVAEKCSSLSTDFYSKCNGLVVNNQDIYDDIDLNDYIVPKSYKFALPDDTEEKEKDTNDDYDVYSDTINRINEPDLKLISLKQLGLKIKPY